jgi:hypothetical protein
MALRDPRMIKLEAAIAECDRFARIGKEALLDETPRYTPSKIRAAARRASLDATRALAEWRQTP